MKIPDAFKSKKVQAVVAGILLVIFKDALGLSPEDAANLVKLIMAYLIGQGVADHQKEKVKLENGLP